MFRRNPLEPISNQCLNRTGNPIMADDAPKLKPGSAFGLNPTDDLHDLRMSEAAMPLLEHVKAFIKETVNPMSEEFHRLGQNKTDRWTWAPGQLEVLEVAKDKAKAE